MPKSSMRRLRGQSRLLAEQCSAAPAAAVGCECANPAHAAIAPSRFSDGTTSAADSNGCSAPARHHTCAEVPSSFHTQPSTLSAAGSRTATSKSRAVMCSAQPLPQTATAAACMPFSAGCRTATSESRAGMCGAQSLPPTATLLRREINAGCRNVMSRVAQRHAARAASAAVRASFGNRLSCCRRSAPAAGLRRVGVSQ